MFASRLDEARKLVSKDIIPITPSKQNNEFKSDDKISITRISDDNENPYPSHKKELSNDCLVIRPKKSDIMEKLSEYLFDLFDANCKNHHHIL